MTGETTCSGLTPTAKALYLALLWQATERSQVVVVRGPKDAESIADVLATFVDLLTGSERGAKVQVVPALDVLPHQRLSPHSEITEQRAVGLWRLASGPVPITIIPVESALLRTESPEFYRQLALTFSVRDELPLDEIVAHLESIGYERREPVEMVGEYSTRGGILDVFPAEYESPVRIEFFGDTVEEIRRFDPLTQRSTMKTPSCRILPLLEQPRSRAILHELAGKLPESYPVVPGEQFGGWEFAANLLRDKTCSVLDFTAGALVVLDEPEMLTGAADKLWSRLEEGREASICPPERVYFTWEQFRTAAQDRARLILHQLQFGEGGIHISSRPSMAFHGNLKVAISETRSLVDEGNRVVFFAPTTGEVERLADVLKEYSVPFQLGIEPGAAGGPQYLSEMAYMAGSVASTYLVKGDVSRGTALPDSRLAIFGSDDLFDTSDLVARPPKARAAVGAFTSDLADLKPGDHVVHTEHGIGRFIGLREISQGDHRGDFMLLEYAGEAKLYVPLTRMDLVQKYRGSGDGTGPALDRLGGVTWKKTKARVKAKMRDMADELLKLYASRKLAEGFAYSPDSNWQREFEDAFEFTPTRDQLTTFHDIKHDMEAPQPMDRLLCGDVGFGKTEVAMRAAFKALGDGKQVAVLAPTTVLAFQHCETFKRRFAPFPVRVEMLSRFRSAKEIGGIVQDLVAGKVDIVIGTHRVLSKDVEFRDLGLLIVDEEQRFGVRHKERLKELKKNVDVLTMSATPIPRTLHMSLLGLRDMSVIETAPKDRLAIHTVVAHYHPELIKAAIEQELARGGQVYFIHNRVDTIWSRAASIQEIVPQCRIGVGHGQMHEAELEKVLLGFMRHEYDVFVSTTIVENGLDIPLANTMIVENAERYGLSELYQLRGRVGRSNRRAYAYLLVPPDTELSDIARKRLAALKEFSDLGAGFKIAALDLELRGAGNLLGGEQHGHIGAVGFDLYVRMLEDTVHELQGQPAVPEVHSTLNMGLDLRISPDYISDEHQRLRWYKRIADLKEGEQVSDLLAELRDRYGEPPETVRQLVEFSLLKARAQRLGVESIERRHGTLNVKFHQQSQINPAALMEIVGSTPGAQFTPAGVLRLPLGDAQSSSELLKFVHRNLNRL
jgi:transcription-repair coupling factor (superfamily II helicase)